MSTALYLIWCSFIPPLHTDLFLFLTEFISLIFRPFPTGIHTLHPQLSCFFVHVVFVSAWESNGSAPGYQLTVCCTGSTGLHLCRSFPSRCLPYSASRSRTCLTPQPLSEMDGRRKYTLLLWVPHTQWGATKCPAAASWKWKKRRGGRLLIASSYGGNMQGLIPGYGYAAHRLSKISKIQPLL